MKKLLQCIALVSLTVIYHSALGETLGLRLSEERRFFLQVEIAADATARQQGLMWRKHLAFHHGLLMLYPRPREVAIWMKNTYIPLDILFLDSDMKVFHIVENTEPLSLKHLYSHGKTSAVLEINAGMAASLGIVEGMRLTFCQLC